MRLIVIVFLTSAQINPDVSFTYLSQLEAYREKKTELDFFGGLGVAEALRVSYSRNLDRITCIYCSLVM
jgi:hypothetical protein